MSELKPCPFCGGIVCTYSQQSRYAPELKDERGGLLYFPTISISCSKCNLTMTCDADESDPYGNKSFVLINAAWNTRAALSQPSVEEDELVEFTWRAILNTPSHPKVTGELLARYEARAAAQAILARYNVTVKG